MHVVGKVITTLGFTHETDIMGGDTGYSATQLTDIADMLRKVL